MQVLTGINGYQTASEIHHFARPAVRLIRVKSHEHQVDVLMAWIVNNDRDSSFRE